MSVDAAKLESVQRICIRIDSFMGVWYFSLSSLAEESNISRLTGVKYPLSHAVLKDSFPLGVSNEIIDREAVLSVGSGLVLVVQSKKQ